MNMKFGPRFTSNALLLIGFAGIIPIGCLSEEEAMQDLGTSSEELSTTTLQAEAQSWATSSGDSVDASSSSARLYANATNDSFKFSQSVPAGQYQVVVRFAQRNVYGNYRLDVNGASVGALNGYSSSSSDSWQTATLGTVDLSGSVEFKLVSTSAGAQDYDLKLDYIELQPTGGGTTTTTTTTTASSSAASSSSGSGGAGGSGGSGGAGGSGGGSTSIPTSIPTPSNGSGEIRTSTTVLKNAANGGSNFYDFANKKIGVNNTVSCDGDQEGQKTVFEVEDGVTVTNLIIAGGLPGGNGIVCLGSCTLDHVYWEDICEDAATNSKDGATMRLNAVIALHASDKVFQHNAKNNSKTIITNSYLSDFGKLWRSCGDCTANGGPRQLVLDNVKVEGIKTAIAGANKNFGDTVTITNLFVKGGYDATKDKPKICTEYIGVTDHNGESTKVNNGASQFGTATCKVSLADVKSW